MDYRTAEIGHGSRSDRAVETLEAGGVRGGKRTRRTSGISRSRSGPGDSEDAPAGAVRTSEKAGSLATHCSGSRGVASWRAKDAVRTSSRRLAEVCGRLAAYHRADDSQ